ncbi:MAG: cytochrome c oxidase subunit 3 [Geminicoccaceae bacterium]|nr:cytochrome c oxidase subunit 3 [Geminicoccaceae bacterium]MCB9945157.1 cytochrome c oxidase subunit 3 [Geminicoccaceae bacterium]
MSVSTADIVADPDVSEPCRIIGNERTHADHRERALGFWLYLMSDAILFAILFANYGVLLYGVAGGPRPHEVFSLDTAAYETAALLISSLTFGFVSICALSGKRFAAIFWLLVTMGLGACFLYFEFHEFAGLVAEGSGPWRSGFLSGFFALVGAHGLHVSVGMIMLAVLVLQLLVKGTTEPVLSRLYRVGLFWHFLDIIWIGIFSFVYLPGVLP